MTIGALITQLIVGVSLMLVGYLLMPKVKTAKPPAVDDLATPTSDANRPIPVPFGRLTIKSPNFIYAGKPLTQQKSVEV